MGQLAVVRRDHLPVWGIEVYLHIAEQPQATDCITSEVKYDDGSTIASIRWQGVPLTPSPTTGGISCRFDFRGDCLMDCALLSI